MADLVTTISETLTLNGVSQGGITTKTHTGINDVYKRIIQVPAKETTLYTTDTTTVGGSQFESDLIKYVRITNLDASDTIHLIIEATDEIGLKLAPGETIILTDHLLALEAIAGDVSSTAGVLSIKKIIVADGDAASGMVENESLTLTDAKGIVKKYVIVDDNATAVATGDILVSGSDVGATTAGVGNAGGIAVAINTTGSAATQNAFLVQLKAAIEHANGHPDLTVSAVPGEADGAQFITITSEYYGTCGNVIPTTDISQLTVSVSTAGVNEAVTGLASIISVHAMAATSTTVGTKLELFIASE